MLVMRAFTLRMEIIIAVIATFSLAYAKYSVGIDVGTESVRVGIFSTASGKLAGTGVKSYETKFPKSGWAEQAPDDWYTSLCEACSLALTKAGIIREEIISICIDTTACSVVALDENFKALRPCLLWMDARSALQTKYILNKGNNDKSLFVNCGGKGPLSAEWMLPKALWIKEQEPHIWDKAVYICEKQDFLNYKLTGRLCASGCNVAARWHWDGQLAADAKSKDELLCAQPVSLLEKIGLSDLLSKWPSECVAMGHVIAPLSKSAAVDLGLPVGIPVCQGGPDAYVGMVGLGCVEAGQLALITGSSHLHLSIGSVPRYVDGVWGAYKGAPLPGLCFAEGGQSSTGSVLSWARRLFSNSGVGGSLSYSQLDEEASKVPIGADGLIALETFQGSRTPVTDPLARGALLGLSLSHTRAHIWRALLEAVCLGTRAALEAMYAAGYTSATRELLVAGGATRSDFWLQMHADVTGLAVIVGEFDNAPLLGSAVLAAVGGGVYATVGEAVRAMVRPSRRLEPRPEMTAQYDRLFALYKTVAPSVAIISHNLASASWSAKQGSNIDKEECHAERRINTLPSSRVAHVVPSILAADLSNLLAETTACTAIGAKWIHVDVCDGSDLCQGQLTFGPLIVDSLHHKDPSLLLDVHVATRDPHRLVEQMAAAGAYRYTFQLEGLASDEEAIELAQRIRKTGMRCGVCIAPSTPVSKLFSLLKLRWQEGEGDVRHADNAPPDAVPLIDLVDILAVEPGIGGQKFNPSVLQKIEDLNRLFPDLPFLAVDGGIDRNTAMEAAKAGANVLIAGSSIFKFDRVGKSVDDIESFIQNNVLHLETILVDNGK